MSSNVSLTSNTKTDGVPGSGRGVDVRHHSTMGDVTQFCECHNIGDRSATIGACPDPPNPDVRRRLCGRTRPCAHAAGSPPAASRTSPTPPGCQKGSFYAYFPARKRSPRRSSSTTGPISKRGFCRSSTTDGPAQERIVRFFHALADEHEAGEFLLGCLIGNLSLELGGSSDPVRDELAQHPRPLGRALTACVRSGQNGRVAFGRDLDADELAASLIEAWEGAALRGKVTRSRTPYDRFESDHRPGAAALDPVGTGPRDRQHLDT